MKDISELNPKNYPTNPNIDKNLKVLFDRLLEMQAASKMNFIITSGLRSEAKQKSLIDAGKTKAIHSLHLAGAAADVLDKDGNLKDFILKNPEFLKSIGFWCEHPDYTKGWMHFQILAPKSGKRFFIP